MRWKCRDRETRVLSDGRDARDDIPRSPCEALHAPVLVLPQDMPSDPPLLAYCFAPWALSYDRLSLVLPLLLPASVCNFVCQLLCLGRSKRWSGWRSKFNRKTLTILPPRYRNESTLERKAEGGAGQEEEVVLVTLGSRNIRILEA